MSGGQQDPISIAFLLGKALIACDAQGEAVAVYRDLLKTVPGNFELHFNLSRALKAEGNFDEALVELIRAKAIFIIAPLSTSHMGIMRKAPPTTNSAGTHRPTVLSGGHSTSRNGVPGPI
jgi:Flp pilus assembly protein TadD